MKRATGVMACLMVVVALAGCDYKGAQSLPLPGAVGGDDVYRVTILFSDATNLVPKETCRANDTVVGSVESIELDKALKAKVVCVIRNSVDLPANVTATLRETSLLGERFVGLDPPNGIVPRGRLRPNAVVPETATRVDPNAEMVLGALSQLLNGGSLGSLQTISRELNAALGSSDLRGTIDSFDRVVSKLNAHRGDITASLEGLGRLSQELGKQRGVIATALETVPDGLAVLDRQREKLVAALEKLTTLSDVAVSLIYRSKANTVADLNHLAPVLNQLTKAGGEIARTIERISTFPFPSNTLSALRGNFAGAYLAVTLDIDSLNKLLLDAGGPELPSLPGLPGNAAAPPAGVPLLTDLVKQAGLPDLASLLGLDLGGLSGGVQ
jgi:phospholipid/cholesterol/gamma-HCH transport system substrate-binding protein